MTGNGSVHKLHRYVTLAVIGIGLSIYLYVWIYNKKNIMQLLQQQQQHNCCIQLIVGILIFIARWSYQGSDAGSLRSTNESKLSAQFSNRHIFPLLYYFVVGAQVHHHVTPRHVEAGSIIWHCSARLSPFQSGAISTLRLGVVCCSLQVCRQ